MTVKTKTITVNLRKWFRDTQNPNPSFRQLSLATSQKSLTRTRTGVSLPKHRQIIASQGNATTACSGVFTSLEWSRSSGKILFLGASGNNEEQEVYGDLTPFSLGLPGYIGGWTSNADSRAAAKFLSNIRQAQQAISGPTFFGELKESLQMIRKPAGALQEGIKRYLDDLKRLNAENRRRYFRKRKPEYIRNLTHIASGLWLERAFGWIPLINDIKNGYQAYNNLFEIDRVIAVSGGGHDAHDKGSIQTTGNLLVAGSYLGFTFNQKTREHQVVRYRGAVHAQAETSAWDRLANWGFQANEFLPTAWELLPWSFLIDYFVNIGDLVNALVTDTSGVKWVCRSQVNKVDQVAQSILDKNYVLGIIGQRRLLSFIASPGYYRFRQSNWQRTATGVPTVNLTFSMPTSPWRLANIAALMAQCGIDLNPQQLSGRTFRL